MSVLSKAFACSDAQEQAEMFNTMARELFVNCKGTWGFEQQICWLSDKLNKDGEDFILRIAGFIELRRKDIGC